jgi:hypothetical protein
MSYVWQETWPPVQQKASASKAAPSSSGLSDPMGAAHVATRLHAKLMSLGLKLKISSDLVAMNDFSHRLRGKPVSPYFDDSIAGLQPERAFWMGLEDAGGKPMGLQAFRLDIVESSLADWAQVYTIALYMRRKELLVPDEGAAPRNSITERIRGRLVYQGDLYFDPALRRGPCIDYFGKLGLVLVHMKWQPDAAWGLMGQSMATRGTSTRQGYSYIEKGVLRWLTMSDGIDPVEWIAISERPALEQLIEQELITPQ